MMSPPGNTRRLLTLPNPPELLRPDPSGDQALPFQRATQLAGAPPAETRLPPAIRSPLVVVVRASTGPESPVPSADQELPFQRAMLAAGTPPAALKRPPAMTSSLGITATAFTVIMPGSPGIPVPSDPGMITVNAVAV